MCRFSSATNHAGEVKTAVQMQSALHTNQIKKCGNNHQLHAERRLIRETRYSLQTNVFVIDQHSRVKKEKPVTMASRFSLQVQDRRRWWRSVERMSTMHFREGRWAACVKARPCFIQSSFTCSAHRRLAVAASRPAVYQTITNSQTKGSPGRKGELQARTEVLAEAPVKELLFNAAFGIL